MITRDELSDALANAGVERERVRWSYSGRSMYGRTCFGFVGGDRELATFFYQLGYRVGYEDGDGSDSMRLLERDVELLASVLTVDQMGLEFIYYFPGIDVHTADNEAEREDPDPDPDPDAVRDREVDRELGLA